MNTTKKTMSKGAEGRVDKPKALAVAEKTPSAVAYVRNIVKGMSKRQAARLAGYQPTVPTSTIDKNRTVRDLMASVEDQRRVLQTMLGSDFDTIGTQMAKLTLTAKKDSDKINAARVVNSMLGYDAPKELQVKSMSLIMELSAVSTTSLDDILNAANAGIPK